MLEQIEKGAEISPCGIYRYSLWRIWDNSLPKVMFIGLNPSTADAIDDDRTIIKCINFAKNWGFGGIYMTNLFAYRSTDKSKLYVVNEPVGIDNDKYILKYAEKADKIIAAWGNDGCFLNRSEIVYKLFPSLFCLQINKTGEPKHPLYVTDNTVLKLYIRE